MRLYVPVSLLAALVIAGCLFALSIRYGLPKGSSKYTKSSLPPTLPGSFVHSLTRRQLRPYRLDISRALLLRVRCRRSESGP